MSFFQVSPYTDFLRKYEPLLKLCGYLPRLESNITFAGLNFSRIKANGSRA